MTTRSGPPSGASAGPSGSPGGLIRLGYAEALETILAHSRPGGRIASLPIEESAGMVLAEEIACDVDLPPFDRAAMDGFAFRHADAAATTRWRLAGSIAAGEAHDIRLAAGACVKIMTGAPVPADADTVIPVEETSGFADADAGVVFHGLPPRGSHVAPRGNDLRAGSLLLAPGRLIAAQEIALLATAGRREVRVHDAPRIAFAATGRELREPGEPLPPGCIRNSNAYNLAAQIRGVLARPAYLGLLPDEPEALRAALSRGLAADLLVVSGGVSMGEYDLVPGILAELGVRILFHRLRVRPGQPTLFGFYERPRESAGSSAAGGQRTLVFGLPGNPNSTLLAFDQYVAPAVRRFRGHPQPLAELYEGTLDAGVPKKAGVTALVACRSAWQEGGFRLTPLKTHGSADLAGIRGADAVALIPEEIASPAAGTRVPFRRLYLS